MLDRVVPIYGRGGEGTDPRQKAQASGKKEAEDEAVPRRPAGQRVEPIQVLPLHALSMLSCVFNSRHSVGCLPRKPLLSQLYAWAQRTQLLQPGTGNLQPGLGIIPTLFGLQHAPGGNPRVL